MLSRLAVFYVCWTLCAPAFAQDTIIVSSCPREPTLPVTFQVDCSHVADPATKQLCKPFAENQACKVFFAYRKITGINLEESCPTVTYTIYDKDKWPHQAGEAGGDSVGCGAELMTDYSVLLKSQIGPYDVHEMLHVYQTPLGALPYAHILFGPSMTEARREIGDNKGYWDAMTRLKVDQKNTEMEFQKRTVRPEDQCRDAELYTETSLYLKDPRNVELFYRKLVRGRQRDMADRQARFNRMYDLVSGGTARDFLVSHGCAPF
ncbi:MAG TPA: hypothetical protein VLY23_09550 [Candidatus Acidoferrum sp.]|nr:hypothetical protein [Candidatus Acidoferrum sp.]